MIIQTLLDFMRDIAVNFLSGIAQLWPASNVDTQLSYLSIPSATVGHILAMLYEPGGWGIMVSLLIAYVGVFLATIPIKMILGRIKA